MHDLVITNGVVVDGTGGPRRRADVAIADGRIVGLGTYAPHSARRHLDADGAIVAPGFVDPHTHYDPQLMYDPYAQTSCLHGVTSAVVGNCGFGVAPARPSDRDALASIFARVEEIPLDALGAIEWDFETVAELVASRAGRLGINAGFYVGHSTLRRYVMGDAAHERAATDTEVESMCAALRDAMSAGAAGFSSSHSPTDVDLSDRPVPSRRSDHAELLELARELGRACRGSLAYLPFSAVGGLSPDDGELLLELAAAARLPVIIQGLGARSKVDAPTATWPESRAYLDRARRQGAAIYSMLIARPFHRTFSLAAGTTLYEGVPALHRLVAGEGPIAERRAMLADPEHRSAIRAGIERPNTDPERGPTLAPPRFDQLYVQRVVAAANRRFVGERLSDVAASSACRPVDAMLDIALADDLATEFLWRTDSQEWRDGTELASKHPQMIVGTSDGGAHLNRGDGADFSTYFLRYWVREWERWELEAAVRELTHVPAAILGFTDRGLVVPGHAADIVVFDPQTVGPGSPTFVDSAPGGPRWMTPARGVHATIVNGTPIVVDGEIPDDAGCPGVVLKPGLPLPR